MITIDGLDGAVSMAARGNSEDNLMTAFCNHMCVITRKILTNSPTLLQSVAKVTSYTI